MLAILDPAWPFLAFLAVLYGGRWLLGLRIPPHLAMATVVAFAALLLAITGMVVHELGHALAVRASCWPTRAGGNDRTPPGS
jgi:hypothetical protein